MEKKKRNESARDDKIREKGKRRIKRGESTNFIKLSNILNANVDSLLYPIMLKH